jgi:hypothetical protein
MKRWACLAFLLALSVAAPRASAQTTPGLDVRLERDPRPGALSSALAVYLKVIVAERDTGAVPAADFAVYAFAEQTEGAKTEIFPCAQEHDNSPEVPRGTYACTVLVDHGGRWRFHGVVNRLRANPADPPVALGRAAIEFDINTGEVAAGIKTNIVKGRAIEVALLWVHTGAAGVWLLATGLTSVLALSTLRRRLSPFGLHRLEDRFDLIVKCLWTAIGVLVASGIFLLLNQTAYDTPFSSARLHAVFRLPYGKPYFLALAAKLCLYAVMVAASTLLLREARRRLRVGVGTAVAVSSPVSVESATGAAAPETESPASVRIGAVVLAAGTAGLSLSITLLKYFHELIEAARALL